MLLTVLWLLPLCHNSFDGKAALSRQFRGRQSEATQVSMQANVKHGDYLRTLGRAMTAQCKVLHLLFSQSDYPKIVECHSKCMCVLSQRLWWRLSETRGAPQSCTCLQADQRMWFLFRFLFLVAWPFKHCLRYMVMGWVDSMPSSSCKRWGITILNSHFLKLKAHTQCCSHRLNFGITMATVAHWHTIILIWDTHKGESDPNTRPFRIAE